MEYRIEKDTMGPVEVPADKYWGAQTQRSKMNFKIGDPGSMPMEIIRAFAYLKKAAALTNCDLGVLPKEKSELIARFVMKSLKANWMIISRWLSGKPVRVLNPI